MNILFFLQKPTSSSSHALKLEHKQQKSEWNVDNEFLSTEDSGLEQTSTYSWGEPDQQDDFFSSAMGLPTVFIIQILNNI